MPKYPVVIQEDGYYLPLRYDNFAAINAPVDPPVPWTLVPLYKDVSDAVAQGRELQKQLTDSLDSMGVLKAQRVLQTALKLTSPKDAREFEYRAKLDFPFRFFRGEWSVRFNIMPTRYRFSGEPDPLATTKQRIEFETACAATMKEYLKKHGEPDTTDEQARAAARHFGAPSSFVDFSFSPDVAAYFAHPPFRDAERERGADIGIMYSLGIEDFEKLFGMAAWALPPGGGRDIFYLNVQRTWEIPYRSFDPKTQTVNDSVLKVAVPEHLIAKPMSIRTRLVPAISRIAGQEGFFIELNFEDPDDWWTQVFMWTVLDFASRKWCFLRQDYRYENPEAGVTEAKLFPPDDSDLAELTKDFGRWV